MFSATLHSNDVKAMAAQICQNPILVDLKVSHLYWSDIKTNCFLNRYLILTLLLY